MSSDWRSIYPFQSHFHQLPSHEASDSSSGPRMHYIDQGSGDQSVVCVHGNPTWSFTYRAIATELHYEARVVAVDHVGCGLSDKPQRYTYTLRQHIANLSSLVRQLDLQRVTLVVHDWGGAIGMGMALENLPRIERIVLLNTAVFPPPYIPWRIAVCRFPLLGNIAMRGANVFALAALRITLYRLRRLAPEVVAGLIGPYGSWADRIAIARFVQDIPRRSNQPTWQLLQSIEQSMAQLADRPARIVWGMRDWCFRPECMTRIAQLLPGAKLRRLEDVGHYVMEEAPHEVIDEIRSCLSE